MQPPGTAVATGKEVDETGLLVLDVARIQLVKRNVLLMEQFVSELLVDGVDYGTTLGISEPFLWDPGASQVRDFYNCYPRHEFVAMDTENGYLTIFIRADLICRKTKEIIASGVGASTMEETKYKYRWVENPEDNGIKKEDCKQRRKSKFSPYNWTYRIENPDVSELKNTVTKMAAKRAEVDGSQNLPGVARAMKKIKLKIKLASGVDDSPEWDAFWGKIKQMGLNSDKVHLICKVKSMTEWVDSGKTLNDAIKLCQETRINASKKPDDTFDRGGSPPLEKPPVDGSRSTSIEYPPDIEEGHFREEGEVVKAMEKEMDTHEKKIVDVEANEPIFEDEVEDEPERKINRDYPKITTKNQFFKACYEDFKLQPNDAIKETGTTLNEIADWADAYLQVAGALGFTVVIK